MRARQNNLQALILCAVLIASAVFLPARGQNSPSLSDTTIAPTLQPSGSIKPVVDSTSTTGASAPVAQQVQSQAAGSPSFVPVADLPQPKAPSYPPSPAPGGTTPATELISSQHKDLPQTALNFINQNFPRNDANKELVDYDDDFMDAMFFVQTEKAAGPEAAKQVESMLAKHHSNDELHAYLVDLNQKYPDVTRLYSIGESVEGTKLWALEISENPGKHELLKPEFRYIANIHGNEVVGREMLLHLGRLLLENYSAAKDEPASDSKPSVAKFSRKLLKSTRIHLLPTLNPDGYAKSEQSCTYEKPSQRGRLNANNIDLNRNFPDSLLKNSQDANTQPEVRAIMDWTKSIPFVLSASMHGGALVASIPYDGGLDPQQSKGERPSPDDDVFRHLALTYATSHPIMSGGQVCYDACFAAEFKFDKGITVGSDWYSLYGGMQDWVYEHSSCMDITLELGCNMYPDAKQLPQYWQFNKKALLNYIKQVHRGIKGTVADAISGKLLADVVVSVAGRAHDVRSSSYGDYFRILLPGYYNITFSHPSYASKTVFVTVNSGMASIVNIKLDPIENQPGKSQPGKTQVADPTKPIEVPSDGSGSSDHSLVVATLVMSTITVFILLALAGAYVIQKRRFARSQSVSLELQPTRANLSTTGTGVSLPLGQPASGSSANQHLSA